MMRKSPIFRPLSPGVDPITRLIDLTIGRIIPPERAVTLGIAGDMMRSAILSA